MIPVVKAPEPKDFDKKVRKRGNNFLARNPTALSKDFPPYWQKIQKDLWDAYSGVCAYLAIYYRFGTGASSVDHFVPKSQDRNLTYEWDNYRLSCLKLNRDKNAKNILDPFKLHQNSFFINFLDGSVYPNPNEDPAYQKDCQNTIDALDLNNQNHCDMRIEHYTYYKNKDFTLSFLKKKSPFVYCEIIRQNLQ